jgi:sulfate permease, SulP family
MANTPGTPDHRFAGANNAWLVFRSLDSYRPRFLTCDLVAGLTLAAIAIPEQMATARLGGFSPEIGFFAFLAGSLAFAFFGNNRFLSCGADSTITPIFAGGLIILAASGSAEYAGLAAALALMVGLVLVAGTIFRLGWIADLLSIPVTIAAAQAVAAALLASGMGNTVTASGPRARLRSKHMNAGQKNPQPYSFSKPLDAVRGPGAGSPAGAQRRRRGDVDCTAAHRVAARLPANGTGNTVTVSGQRELLRSGRNSAHC